MHSQQSAPRNADGEVDEGAFDRHLQDILKDALRGAANHYDGRSKRLTDKKQSAMMAFNARRCYSAMGDIGQMRFGA